MVEQSRLEFAQDWQAKDIIDMFTRFGGTRVTLIVALSTLLLPY